MNCWKNNIFIELYFLQIVVMIEKLKKMSFRFDYLVPQVPICADELCMLHWNL